MLRADKFDINELFNNEETAAIGTGASNGDGITGQMVRRVCDRPPPIPQRNGRGGALVTRMDMGALKMPSTSSSDNSDNDESGGGGEWREHVNADGSRVLVKERDDIHAVRDRRKGQSVNKEARDEAGAVIAKHDYAREARELAALQLSQSTNDNADRPDRHGVIVGERSMLETEAREGANQPPPLPPRKEQVTTYIRLFQNPDDAGDATGDGPHGRRTHSMNKQESMDGPGADSSTSDNCRATIASYCLLRENLAHFEAERMPLVVRPGAIVSSYSTSDIQGAMPSGAHGANGDATNLSTIFTTSDDDQLRLPLI